ncbi:DUF547 domain-containing protein [Lewinella sp. W8]|uniref:DUF547 domain-containing protein n=1 Tax=Lewinella sp. W8 TaxID=2528208 RepID=UPI001068B30F|nr:DUF547 domain-containing protein [Lewinella sp. W8]MTB49670.1 DUF547 domain-containing protein [Lewinella sp. W8]
MFKPFTFFALLLLSVSALSARTSTAAFFESTDDLLMRYVNHGRVDYASLKASGALQPLIKEIAEVDLASLGGNERKAFLINAYNLLVIKEALAHYPLKSVLDVNGFFDGRKQQVGGRSVTLNQLEKDILLKQFPDARLHFVLVCGALGCPPITSFAYQPQDLENQLNRQTRKALNDGKFIRVENGGQSVALSQIFNWYAKDFGGAKTAVLDFINRYRSQPLATDAKVSYYEYDWSLNVPAGRAGATPEDAEVSGGGAPPTGGGNNAARYVVSAAIPQGTYEIKIFNNLYSQEAAGERASFFTSTTSALYGLTNRINVGFDLRYRRVRYDEEGSASNFDVFSSDDAGAFRQGVTGFGPKVRIAPFTQLPNFSVQSALWLPIADDPSGAETGQRFIDFDGPTWFTQFFNDFPVGNNFSVFAEVDVLLEDIGPDLEGHINRFSTPLTGIVSYFPNPKTTLYALASYSPYWQEDFDYFYQVGSGAKYQFTPKFELEVLLTAFDNEFISSVDGNAGTVNLGLRFNL